MKALLSTILVVIILIFSYNTYADYQRFRIENYKYQTVQPNPIPDNEQLSLLYFQKVEELNGHIITQWSAHNIDVRNPTNTTDATLAARATYDRILGEVKYLEDKLQNDTSKPITDTTASIIKEQRDRRTKALFTTTRDNALRIGSRGALVFELQKLINHHGGNIPEDGNFQLVTFEALKAFEKSRDLFPDGKLDILTLEYLLEK